jgi:hypothetical protein
MNKPRVLLYDVETSPVLAWTWRTGKQYISHDQFKTGHKFDIICICYKFAGEKEIHSLDWNYQKQDSSEMIQKFGDVVATADLTIGHNSDKFDVKQINTQRMLHNLDPISWPTSEDTLKQMRKIFYFPSYKLDYIAKLLTGSGKETMKFQDWINIVEKQDIKSFTKMIKYCKNDVLKLEEVWNRVKKYCPAKIHAGVITGIGRLSCPRCASSQNTKDGFKMTAKGRTQRFQCQDCGHKWADGRSC